jgi:transcription elongation GreA/GreB family factor
MAVVHVLRHTRPSEAPQYAYELLRHNFNDPMAWQAMIVSLGIGDDKPAKFPSSERVGPGTAMRYREDDTGRIICRIIEDSANPDVTREEIAPDAPLALAMRGKRVGEQFALPHRTIQKQTATIIEILPKYILRWQQCVSDWNDRFPAEDFVERIFVRTAADGKPDFDPILRTLDQRADRNKKVESLYHEHSVPLTFAAQSIGRPVMDVVGAFGRQGAPGIKCCRVTNDDLTSARSSATTSDCFVLDSSSLATLFWLEAGERLLVSPFKYVISEGTYLELRRWANDHITDGASGFLAKVGENQYALIEPKEEERNAFAARIQAFLSLIDRHVVVESGRSVACLPKDQGEELLKVFGRAQLESMSLARSPGRSYWTDDLAAREIGRQTLNLRTVWTQFFAASIQERGILGIQQLDETTLGLLRMRYWYTHLSPSAIVEAAKASSWNIGISPLSDALDWFSNDTTSPDGMAQLAGQSIVAISRAAPLPNQADDLIRRMLERLGSRARGFTIIRGMELALDYLFGLDAINANRVKDLFRAWRASHERRDGSGGIILP